MNYIKEMYGEDYLSHHGILGQKWGIRRYQNPDGSLTPEGVKRYGKKLTNQYRKHMTKVEALNDKYHLDRYESRVKETIDQIQELQDTYKKR